MKHDRFTPRKLSGLPCLRPDAAGIDIGSREIYVAIPPDRGGETVRHFGTVTEELEVLTHWLEASGVTTVAMESTGIYWIPLCRMLEAAGIEVFLVNARELKHVPGRKSDVADCQWLQQLHSVGLLRKSFRPSDDIEPIRSLYRHRENLLKQRATQIHLMQKALRLMNIQLETAVTDVTGETGMRIIRSIVGGEHNPHTLATLRDPRCKNSPERIARALHGTYAQEHLFTLRQVVSLYDTYTLLIGECDQQLLSQYRALAHKMPQPEQPDAPPPRTKPHRKVNPLEEEIRKELYRITGTDLTQIDGIGLSIAQLVIAEAGVDTTAWNTAKRFSSWLGACPLNDISGGKTLRTGTKPTTNRLLVGLRMAALTLEHSDSSLGAFHRRMKAKLGAPKAITATAHKLARIIFTLLKHRQPYHAADTSVYEQQYKERQLKHLRRQATKYGYTLVLSS